MEIDGQVGRGLKPGQMKLGCYFEGRKGLEALPGSLISWVRRQMASMGLKDQKHDY